MNKEYNRKIQKLRCAIKDEPFLEDLREVSDDFKDIDLEGWSEEKVWRIEE